MISIPFPRHAAWLVLGAMTLCPGPLPSFTVVKNVNTGKSPEDKVVIFEKGQASDTVSFFESDSGKMGFTPEGEIEARITGNGDVKCGVHWKPRGNLAETFNAADYGFVVMVLRVEGANKQTNASGNVTETRPDNLWLPVALFNEKGEAVGSANLADGTDDRKTPAETRTIVLPMMLFTYFGDKDVSKVSGVGFTWNKPRANISRDFRIVIEKIALAN